MKPNWTAPFANIWTREQDALLRAMYPLRPMAEIIEATGRSKEAIYARAQRFELKREHQTQFGKSGAPEGHKFQKGCKPWNAGKAVFKITSRDRVLGEFRRDPIQTTKSLSAATGVRRSGCWIICNELVKKGQAYISGWKCSKETNWNKEAEYTFGQGESLPWTPRQKKSEIEEDPYQILPVPRPTLGVWGLCWPITNGANGAGKEQAAA